jgi:hypothetical protein
MYRITAAILGQLFLQKTNPRAAGDATSVGAQDLDPVMVSRALRRGDRGQKCVGAIAEKIKEESTQRLEVGDALPGVGN